MIIHRVVQCPHVPRTWRPTAVAVYYQTENDGHPEDGDVQTKTAKKMRPTSIMLGLDSLGELRELALRQSLRSGVNVTTSSLVRHIVEDFLESRRKPVAAC